MPIPVTSDVSLKQYREEGGGGGTENKTTVKEELSLGSESYAAMVAFVLEFSCLVHFLHRDLTPYSHCTHSHKTDVDT